MFSRARKLPSKLLGAARIGPLLLRYAAEVEQKGVRELGDRVAAIPLGPSATESQHASIRETAATVLRASRLTLGRATCVARALTTVELLRRRGVAATFHFGIARDDDGAVVGHAWVQADGLRVLTGRARDYAPLTELR